MHMPEEHDRAVAESYKTRPISLGALRFGAPPLPVMEYYLRAIAVYITGSVYRHCCSRCSSE